MKKNNILVALVFCVICISCYSQHQNKQNLKDIYFGLKAPDLNPEIFAPDIISTDEFEFGMAFSNDGNEIYFTRRPNYNGSNNRIYATKFKDHQWSTPKLASFGMNTFEFEPTISPDGSILYFYSERDGERDSRFDGDLWMSTRQGDDWSKPVFMKSPINKKYCMSVSPSTKGNLFFASNYNGKRGIYKANVKAKSIDDLEYLPKEINEFNGAHPFIAPDESYIIFDAQLNGWGKPELFISFKKEDSTWTKAINMGPEINLTKTEFGAIVSPDGKFLFFHRRVNGKGDLYCMNAKIIQVLKNKSNTKS